MLPHKSQGSVPYIQKGNHPKLLVISGMHGDEFSSINLIQTYLQENDTNLPDYLYIPEFSPSAVYNKTRKNNQGVDINRSFFETSQEQEVQDNISLLSNRHFDLCLDFHEDTCFAKEYYVYDSKQMNVHDQEILRSEIIKCGAAPYVGVDDPDDPTLRYQVSAGYTSTPLSTLDPRSGFFWTWALKKEVIKRIFDIEIPTQGEITLKKKLIKMSFDFFLKFA